jgi:hypothetical protein
MAASARGRLEAGLRLLDAITVELNHAHADLRTGFAGDPRIRRLPPIPGIGLVTAATVVAEVWDLQRFPAPERLCPWPGSPRGAHQRRPTRRGPSTKQGSRWLRWLLVEAATSAVRDPQQGRFTAQTPSAAAQDRPGGAGPAAAHPVLRRPMRPGWLPCLPRRGLVAAGVVRARSVGVSLVVQPPPA